MSATQCRHFVQNAWKKELCSNCFKSREEHTGSLESTLLSRTYVARAAGVKRVAHKVQGILRLKESNASQVRCKRKNVAFPESLTEIIGYDGGDDLDDNDEAYLSSDSSAYEADDDPDNGSYESSLDDLPDSEEERILGNLTRANTNFNTVTANLNAAPEPNETTKTPAKNFSSLMLGRTQKDADGRKTTLLVTVTPFGGDESVPTAKRPIDKKPSETTKPKPNNHIVNNTENSNAKTELSTSKSQKKSNIIDNKPIESSPTIAKPTSTPTTTSSSSLGKIVDMPLITSTSLITSLRDSDDATTGKRSATSISRTPAIKKPENEKPRIARDGQTNSLTNANVARNHKNLDMSKGVELTLSPVRAEVAIVKEISSYKATNLVDLAERKVEGEAASEKYRFEESRESAGEPDGKADEEVIAEPPALPKSPPPIESAPSNFDSEPKQRISSDGGTTGAASTLSTSAEPRASFLHGISESKAKPTVPQKPLSLPASKAVGSSLASLLSESRAFEYRLSQSQNAARTGAALVHSQSESQLCAVEEVAAKRIVGQSESAAKPAQSCGQLASEMLKTEQTESEEPEAEDDEDSSEASSSEQPQLRSSTSKRRQAPQPPSSSSPSSLATSGNPDDGNSSLFARNPNGANSTGKSDCPPVVREKEKRERASSCSPKFRQVGAVCEMPDPTGGGAPLPAPPEPAPRRNISLSQDSLAAASCERVEEKKKARSKFSLKKFLRMGTRKDVDMTCGSSSSRSDEIPSTPQPKPRLEIIHPLELDGAAVQVLRNDKISSTEGTTDTKSENRSVSHQQQSVSTTQQQHIATRPSKPPPPPRAQSLDDSSRPGARTTPKQQQQQPSNNNNNTSGGGSGGGGKPLMGKSWQPSGGSSASDSIYANLGKFRPIQCN